ncbi:hypothetical protein OH76DRAFT_1128501 [Lentinus brumalis]|uniref:Secreted protein n=1 Tax=Lentinus brumalis TaxID=2498619 RepID=A0A371CUH1_9APHY|nr:hypothetical protein OH76DRAFT_1128501 [Polyporus brumalis]
MFTLIMIALSLPLPRPLQLCIVVVPSRFIRIRNRICRYAAYVHSCIRYMFAAVVCRRIHPSLPCVCACTQLHLPTLFARPVAVYVTFNETSTDPGEVSEAFTAARLCSLVPMRLPVAIVRAARSLRVGSTFALILDARGSGDTDEVPFRGPDMGVLSLKLVSLPTPAWGLSRTPTAPSLRSQAAPCPVPPRPSR